MLRATCGARKRDRSVQSRLEPSQTRAVCFNSLNYGESHHFFLLGQSLGATVIPKLFIFALRADAVRYGGWLYDCLLSVAPRCLTDYCHFFVLVFAASWGVTEACMCFYFVFAQ